MTGFGRHDMCVRLAFVVLTAVLAVHDHAQAGTLDAGAVRVSVIDCIERFAAAHGLDVEATVPNVPDITVTDTDTPVIHAEMVNERALASRVPVRLEIGDGKGNIVRRSRVVADVCVYREVAVALRDIRRGDPVDDDAFAISRVDVCGVRDYLIHEEQLAGTEARRAIRAGTVITVDMVRPIPIIARGDEVTIEARVNNIRIVAQGIARQDGGRGETIRVTNGMNGTTIQCVVIDGETVMAGMD